MFERLRHYFRRRNENVRVIRSTALLYVAKYRPDDLELADLKLRGCTTVFKPYEGAQKLFRCEEPTMDNISAERGVPLFYGSRAGFHATLFLVARGLLPLRAIATVKRFCDFSLSREEARLLVVHANINKSMGT